MADKRTIKNKTTLSLQKSDGDKTRLIYELSDNTIVRFNVAKDQPEPKLDEVKRKARVIANYISKKQQKPGDGQMGGKQ